jgi:hypothetical protein
VRIHANLRSLTVEELKGQKRDAHLTAFRYMVAETARDLERIAREEGAHARLQGDYSREWGGATHTVEGLVAKIVRECEAALARHAAAPPEQYHVDEAHRALVVEMMQVLGPRPTGVSSATLHPPLAGG